MQATSELPTAAVVHMLKITGHQGVARQDESGLQDSLDQKNIQGEGGNKGEVPFFTAVIPRAMGNPKINIG